MPDDHTTYRLVFEGDFVRVVADDGVTVRSVATCRGDGVGAAERWPQAVKDAELIVAALNAVGSH